MTTSLIAILGFAALSGCGAGLLLYDRFLGRIIRFRSRQRIRRVFADTQSFHLPGPVEAEKMSFWATLGMALSPSSLTELDKTRKKLNMAGFRREEHIGIYYIAKYGAALAALCLGAYLWHTGIIPPAAIIISAVPFLLLPDITLLLLTRRRLQKVTLALPDFIDLCNVSMTAGLSWLISVKRVIRELESIHPQLCREFSHLFDQIQTGMNRIEAFNQLAKNNPVSEMQYLVNVLIQNERMGSSISSALADFSQRIYQMRQQTMEEKAGKLSAKMAIVILPFLLLPYILIMVSEQMVGLWRMLTS